MDEGSAFGPESGPGGKAYLEYLDRLGKAVGHRDRVEPLRSYLTGLVLPGERKTLEPIAGRLDPDHVSRRHQSLHHFVNEAPWSDEAVLRVARQEVLGLMGRIGGLVAWSVGEVRQPKKGESSVGVDRQPLSPSGPSANCQVSVQVSLVNESISLPAAWHLFLPQSWTQPGQRRESARVPPEVGFRTREEIALDAIEGLLREGVPRAPVIAPTPYGSNPSFRSRLTERGFSYVVGVPPWTRVVAVEAPKLPVFPGPSGTRLRWPWRRRSARGPRSALELACMLPASAWSTQSWTEGDRGTRQSRFAVWPVRSGSRARRGARKGSREGLLIEWPEGNGTPWNFWLSTVGESGAMADLVRLAKLPWRVQQDHVELSQEFGLTHFEGRSWRGFHHHASLSIAAYAFWASRRVERSAVGPNPAAAPSPTAT
ncbi:MAG TPA: IS701 family transposase [Thermoplasmata archaeon]|nr:IS701 family transposase [Thermoplasmata archaeon]